MTWECHADDSAKGRYKMISFIFILTSLGINLKLYEHFNKESDGHLKTSTAPIIDSGADKFKDLDTGNMIPQDYFINAYVEEVNKSDEFHTHTKKSGTILDDKY